MADLETSHATIDHTGLTGVGGASTLAVLAETLVAGSVAATIDFTSIPGTHRHLMLIVQGRSNDAGATAVLNMTFNADTGGNYDFQRLTTTNATLAGAAGAAQTAARAGVMTAAGATANNPGTTIIHIPNYAGTVFNKTATAAGHEFSGTAATSFISETNYMHWRSTAAITRITLTPSAGSWIIGSIATLYGLDN